MTELGVLFAGGIEPMFGSRSLQAFALLAVDRCSAHTCCSGRSGEPWQAARATAR